MYKNKSIETTYKNMFNRTLIIVGKERNLHFCLVFVHLASSSFINNSTKSTI